MSLRRATSVDVPRLRAEAGRRWKLRIVLLGQKRCSKLAELRPLTSISWLRMTGRWRLVLLMLDHQALTEWNHEARPGLAVGSLRLFRRAVIGPPEVVAA